jgi:hypothetical protein
MHKNKGAKAKRSAQKPISVPSGFDIPESFFSQLDEFSNGGYVLFYVNGSGGFGVRNNFDGDIQAVGLNNFIRYYSQTLEDIQASTINDKLSNGGGNDGGDGEASKA